MDKLTLAICVVCFVAVFLPAAFVDGAFYCNTCTSDPLTSVSQCNVSTTSRDCKNEEFGPLPACYGATAELMNGTFVAIKDCYIGNDCNSTTACATAENGTGISFKCCQAYCCNTYTCNKNLLTLPSSKVPAATASVTTVSATQTPSTAAPVKADSPCGGSSTITLSNYLSVVLLVAIKIMS